MKLTALNLPRDLGEKDLADLFKHYGNIKSCSLVLNKDTGKSKGFGFIEMELKTDGETALKELHGTIVGNNKIRVKQAKSNI